VAAVAVVVPEQLEAILVKLVDQVAVAVVLQLVAVQVWVARQLSPVKQIPQDLLEMEMQVVLEPLVDLDKLAAEVVLVEQESVELHQMADMALFLTLLEVYFSLEQLVGSRTITRLM
jgi:hypothetical protein